MRRRLIAIVTLAVLACAWGGCLRRPSSGRRSFDIAERVTIKPELFRSLVTDTGELRPRDVVVVPGPISGEILYLIAEGTYVEKGDKLAVIDDHEWSENVERDEFLLGAAQARIERTKLERELTGKRLSIERDLVEVELDQHLAELKHLLAKPTDEEKREAEVKVERAQASRDAASAKYGRSRMLAEKGVVSRGELIRDKLQYQQAQAALDKAVVEHQLTLKGAPHEDITIARQRVEQGKVKVEQAAKNLEAQLALKDTAVEVALAEVQQKEDSLRRGRKIMNSAIVYAPCEGTVLYNIQWGQPEEGKRTWQGGPFLDIVNLSKMAAETRVNEVDFARIGVGQKVGVTLEAFPKEKFHGRVARVAGIAKDRSAHRQGMGKRSMSGVMIFELMVEIEETDPRLRPTMTATLDIVVGEKLDAIAIPYRAIQEELIGNPSKERLRKFVYLEENGDIVERDIETGQAGASRIVVTKGLSPGDVVLIPKRTPGT